MDIEGHIKSAVLDQDHLADLLVGNEAYVDAIRARVIDLLKKHLVEIYTHTPNGSILVLGLESAISIASERKHWVWRSESGDEQLFFLSPVRQADGRVAYGV